MSEPTIRVADRTGWPAGPWDGEPDDVRWRDEASGLPCIALRHPRRGHWCGYVGIPAGHPSHGKDWSDVDEHYSVHGGLTYSGACDSEFGVCHVPEPGETDDFWWFGFDCAHWRDLAPAVGDPLDEEYRSIGYVRRQCSGLAAQLVPERPQ